MESILAGLNEEQRAAVTHTTGPLMIIAGAGTGKTTVMTRRIAWLIEQKHATPDQILALTFTDKAANEMEERVDRLLPYGYVDLWISTFHAFCQRVIQQHGFDIGLTTSARLLTETEAWLLMQRHWHRFALEYYKPLGHPTKWLQALLTHIARAKDEGISAEQYRQFADAQDGASEDQRERLQELARAYETYEQILREENALDFGGLLLAVHILFTTRPAILRTYTGQFLYVIVDEFQDTNWVQYALVKLLAGTRNNIAVVGDDDQAIYRFRGASIEHILRFESDFPGTAHVVLTKNYRSVQPILDRAYMFIAQNNPHRLEASLQATHALNKQLVSQRAGEGFIQHLHAETGSGEAQEVTRQMVALKAATECEWSDMAILVRANDHAEPFLVAMEAAGIPYMFFAMRGLYRKPIVLDAAALLRVIADPRDSTSLYRVLSHPGIGLPAADLATLLHAARRTGSALQVALERGEELSLAGAERVQEWKTWIQDMQAYARRRNVLEVLAEALRSSGLYGSVLQMEEGMQAEQSSLLQQFYERVRRFVEQHADANVQAFVLEFDQECRSGEAGELAPDLQHGPDEVRVMTLHASKGLEFRFVFLVNMVDRRFPSQRRADAIPLPEGLCPEDTRVREAHLEEERRLCYVGMTRAKEGLILTSADRYGGAQVKKLSRFLVEMGHKKPSAVREEGTFLQTASPVVSPAWSPEIPSTFSFSQLTTYARCPLQYKFAHVLRIPTFGTPAMSFGSTMHRTLQAYLEPMRDGGAPGTQEELLALYRQYWINEWYEDDAQRESYRQEGERSLRGYHAQVIAHPPTPIFLERGFTLKIDEITLRGRIDRIDQVDGGVEVIDYKTGTPKTQATLSSTDKMQLMLYQLAAQELFGLVPQKLTFHYLQDHTQVSFLATEQELERLRETIRKQVAQIQARQFEPLPGFLCQQCPYKDICPFRAT